LVHDPTNEALALQLEAGLGGGGGGGGAGGAVDEVAQPCKSAWSDSKPLTVSGMSLM